MGHTNLNALLAPRNIAVVGASRKPGKAGHEVVANLLRAGFSGEIIPVNSRAESVLELPCYESLRAYGKPVDLAIIAVPRFSVLEVVRDGAAIGLGAAVVLTVGFRETGEEGERLERELAEFCAARRIRLLGPNCMGVINTAHSMNGSIIGEMPKSGTISVFSQSGAICAALLDLTDVGLAKVLSIGNKADISEIDLLRFLGGDEQTKVIVGYLEDIRCGDEFIKVAEEVSSRKPVVLLKAGTTSAGLKTAASHTGVLASTEIAHGAAFKRSGVVRADTFVQLMDFAGALALQPLPPGDRVLILTNAGGPGAMTADAVEKAGLRVCRLNPAKAALLRDGLLPQASVDNMVLVLGDAGPDHYQAAVQAGLADPGIDAVIVVLAPQAMSDPLRTAKAIGAVLSEQKPVLAAFLVGRPNLMPGGSESSIAGLPMYPSPERAVATLAAMHGHAVWRKRPPRVVTRFPVNRRRVERILNRHRRQGRLSIGEVKTKEIVRAYGFNVPEGYLAATVEEAIEAAERIGYPVALKIVCPDIVHKTEVDGVRLNISNLREVRDGFDLLMLRVAQHAPDSLIEGVYVEKMVRPGQEVIIGMNRDPQFGPMLMFGLGGIFVETMKDVTFHLAPVTAEEAIQMLESTRSYEILRGRRGGRGVDVEAIALGIQRISQLTTDFPEIDEFEINPYIVSEMGREPMVADGRIILRNREVCLL